MRTGGILNAKYSECMDARHLDVACLQGGCQNMSAKFTVFGNKMQVIARNINSINVLRAPKPNDGAVDVVKLKYMLLFGRFG